MAQRPVTLTDIVRGHVSLEIEGFDRLYFNGWVPALQTSGQIAGWLHWRGFPIASPAALGRNAQAFRAAVRRYAALDPRHLDPQRPAHGLAVRLRDSLLGVVLALVLLRLLVQAVAHPRVASQQLAVARHAHSLGDALPRLDLRHWLRPAPSARRPPGGMAPGS